MRTGHLLHGPTPGEHRDSGRQGKDQQRPGPDHSRRWTGLDRAVLGKGPRIMRPVPGRLSAAQAVVVVHCGLHFALLLRADRMPTPWRAPQGRAYPVIGVVKDQSCHAGTVPTCSDPVENFRTCRPCGAWRRAPAGWPRRRRTGRPSAGTSSRSAASGLLRSRLISAMRR